MFLRFESVKQNLVSLKFILYCYYCDTMSIFKLFFKDNYINV